MENTKIVSKMEISETAYFRRDGFFYVWRDEQMVLYVPNDYRVQLEKSAHNYIPVTRTSATEIEVPREHIDGIKRDFWLAEKPPLSSTAGYLRVIEV